MKRKSKATHFNASLELLVRFLLLAILFIICYQVGIKWLSFNAINVVNYPMVIGALLLVPANLWLEWKRFHTSVFQYDISRADQVHAFYQGIVVSFFSPALIATTLGRMGYKNQKQNIQWMYSGVHTGLAQFIVTMFFAFVASVYLFGFNRLMVPWIFSVAIILSLLAYVLRFKFPSNWLRWSLIQKLHEVAQSPNKLKILGFSIIRYAVFSAQFHLILGGFGVFFSVQQLFILMLSYGLITLSPSILFGKIVIRELIAVAVFSWFDYPKEEIMLTAFFTWGFNVVLPVLFALIRISSTWKARFFS